MIDNNLFDAIYKRCSIRKYKLEPLASSILKEVEEYTHIIPKLSDIDMKIHIVEDGKKIQDISKGIIGSYGKIKAPHYLVVTSEEKPGYMENVGYSLEHLVLKLTTLNLGTCWIGGFIKKELLTNVIEMPNNHVAVIVISFGYPLHYEDATPKKLEDNLIDTIGFNPNRETDIPSKLASSAKRKALSEIIDCNLTEDWLEIMNAVRHAPSAINSQPWRFFKKDNIIHMYRIKRGKIAKNLDHINKIDSGIALCHLMVAGILKGKKLTLEYLDNMERKNLVYFISIIEN
ncbi:nitroreductase family protein [Clostridium argentinense CDC 2741]|uniref:Nitroreductase family protein n=1 Tax=Clostridium argentinense CDC 2741 TaxID=1418104 RepID=A0A0C1R9R1_9CLOT|nr:nitroreductase family protein [Clostridium argentinense]ARC85446.1 hypothetical protein RSJ17_13520 [Clostridium argentinense]KIE47191.1 nitroreductase family protein [Clostridium argentinense CDC 2741]